MSYIAEFEVSSSLLNDSTREVPSMKLHTDEFRSLPNGEWIFVFWAEGADFGTFGDAMETDPTIQNFSQLAVVEDRRLYRVTLSEDAEEHILTPNAAKFDIFFFTVLTTHESMWIRARVPTRDALREFRQECVDDGRDFQLLRVYNQETAGVTDEYGLTETQRATLRTALEEGYFEVPREVSQEALASELGVSDQALSARIRRGVTKLVESTLAKE